MNVPGAVTSIAERLSTVPHGVDVALVVRHAEREAIPAGEFGVDVPLTARGVAAAGALGRVLSVRERATVVSSPVPRCVQTAEAALRGGGWSGAVTLDRRLGDPGPFVVDPEVSGALFLKLPIPELVRRQLSDPCPPAGMRSASEGVKIILGLVAGDLQWQGRLNVYVTHDTILAVLLARLFRLPIDDIDWPQFLDGLFLWRSGGQLNLSWRGLPQASHPSGG